MLNRSITLAAVAATMLAFTVGAASAETMKIKADLKGSAETPANDSKGTGTLTGTFDPTTKKLTWDVTFSDLSGPATAAHFHAPAPVGKSAGVEIPIKPPVESPIKGEATLTDDQVKNLKDSETYFNVHTAKHPKGEIRGQIFVMK